MLAGEDWHAGVIGIVASRLADRHQPSGGADRAGGGARTRLGARRLEAFDLLAGLTACSEHLSRYGGHRAAAGLEIERERVADFAAALDAHAARVLSSEDMAPVERVDAVVDGSELGMALAEELRRLAPFGRATRRVSLMIARGDVRRRAPDGRRQARALHRATLRRARARAVAFNTGGAPAVAEGEPAQATFALEVNEWNGVSEPRLVLRRARPAGEPASRTAVARPRRPRPGAPASSAPAQRERFKRSSCCPLSLS